MNHTEQFLTILKRDAAHELLPFLKSIDEKEVKGFAAELKEICKGWLEYKQVQQSNSITFKRKATDKQAELISYAALAFLNQKEFEKAVNLWSVRSEKLDEILAWRCPKWFNQFINKFGTEDFVPNFISYDWIVHLSKNGYIIPTKELVVKTLPPFLFESAKDHKYHVRPENLLKYEITPRSPWFLLNHVHVQRSVSFSITTRCLTPVPSTRASVFVSETSVISTLFSSSNFSASLSLGFKLMIRLSLKGSRR